MRMSMMALAWLAMVSCQNGKSSSEMPTLLEVSAGDLGGVDSKQWSEVKDVDGRQARLVLNDEAVFTVPAWWGKAARPDAGEIYVLEIDYKDVASGLAIVSSFGNCENSIKYTGRPPQKVTGRTNGLSELHRIAGENTGEWKTALVPVSWDYLFAGEGNPMGVGHQQFSIRLTGDDKDLPISAIRVRKATKEDEVRYNAETRAWIRKSQQEYYGADSAAVATLPAAWESKAVVPYVRSYLTPILPADVPADDELNVPVKVKMARNEIESRQLGIYANGKEIEGVSIAVSPLKNDQGASLNVATNLYTVEYAFVKSGRRAPQIDAQRIWPLFETPVKAGHSQAFWLTFETKEETAEPGTYKGEISILSNGAAVEKLPLEIEVMPVTLLTMNEAGLSMGGCVTGFVPFHNIDYAVKNNVNATNLWFSTVRPAMAYEDGKLVLDFTLIDEWMKQAKRHGWQNIVYFLGGNPYGFPRTMTLESELFVLKQKEGTREEKIEKFLKRAASQENRDKVLEEIRGDYKQWVKEVYEHAVANGWPELIFTPFDEPAKHRQKPYRKEGHQDDELVIGTGPWIKGHFEDGCAIIRSAAPEARIYGSIHHSSGIEFLKDINVFCTNAIHMDPLLGDKVRAGGEDKYFWQYTGVGAGSDPARVRYSFGFYFGAFDSRGSLLWAYNWGNRFDTTEGNNWMICWDTPFSTIPTLSYEGLREAWDDRRYIETLKQVARSKDASDNVHAFLDEIFTKAVHSKTEGGEDTVNDFWNETTSLDKLDEWRYAIAGKIVALSDGNSLIKKTSK